MEAEHTKSADSRDHFSTSNYGVITTPETEWLFVTDADALLRCSLPESERDRRCPKETKNIHDEGRRRQPMLLAELRGKLAEKNAQLELSKDADPRLRGRTSADILFLLSTAAL